MKIRNYPYYNQEKDLDDVFYNLGSVHYNVNQLAAFNEAAGTGEVNFRRNERKARFSFNLINNPFEETQSWTFPPSYPDNPNCPFALQFVGENVLRLKFSFNRERKFYDDQDSPMFDQVPKTKNIQALSTESTIEYKTSRMRVLVNKTPFSIEIYDSENKLLTKTLTMADSRSLMNYAPLPFSYVETENDLHRYAALSLQHKVGENFYGVGESFTQLNKTGQKITLWTQDAHGSEGQTMYKPVPFYFSTEGYGVFVHSGAPMTFDFGWQFAEAQTLFVEDDVLDVFIFVGDPKEVIGAYTQLTGKSPLPPLWSFGLWMSRITYDSEQQAREVARKLQEYEIPCDVIHLDTGWFEEDWLCDFEFSTSRFENPRKMLEDLREQGYRVSLWQYPYLSPRNPLYAEAMEQGYAILNADGRISSHDAIIDMSNPEAVKWYQSKLAHLLDLGVSAFKTDFGEAAPLQGCYHSGHSGRMEHNLYPLRYCKAASDLTKEKTGEVITWGRSAWAGSQRYPIHWAGDTENTNMGMLTCLRGGLSLGNSGFSFFSNDVGGFAKKSEEELYSRWMFMGIFTSHMRCHGQPPKEPWAFSENFLKLFRKQMELRYSLMPYIMREAAVASENGLPLQQSMNLAYSSDKNCRNLEDQYMFGRDILVAPLFEANQEEREVYLPEGNWYEPFTMEKYEGKAWHTIKASDLNGVVLVREDAVIPRMKSALSTSRLDWSTVRYEIFGEPMDCINTLVYDVSSHSLVEAKIEKEQIINKL